MVPGSIASKARSWNKCTYEVSVGVSCGLTVQSGKDLLLMALDEAFLSLFDLCLSISLWVCAVGAGDGLVDGN